MNKHLIAGTAGHIDHGKTTLIRALTGIDTDRLKEEKERGITIELGFAHLKLPGGDTLGIVDVPGHERFVRHMVAGAAGIDLVMLVIAADEGVMPQTREHLDICRMLDIKRGLIVLTKKDLVDPEWLELVTDDVRQFSRGTFLEGEPIIPVSSTSGEGLPALAGALETLVKAVEPRSPWGIFRLPVDRVFTMKGFGTVVTGTTTSGTVKVGDPVRIYPRDLETRVRGLQVHNLAVQEAEAGCRTAINLQGIEKDQVARGDIIGHPGQLVPSYILDVRLHLLPSLEKPLKDRTRVRLHLGTGEILARVHLLEEKELEPGREALAQIRLERPTAALARDRFVIRAYSPVSTVGGGIIIDPAAEKHSRRRKTLAAVIQTLKSLEKGSPAEALLAALRHDGPAGGTPASLSRSLNMDEALIGATLEELVRAGSVHRTGPAADPFVHAGIVDELKNGLLELLDGFHRSHPLKAGLSREEMKTKLPKNIHPRVLARLMEVLESEQSIVAEGKLVRLASFRVQLDGKQQQLRDAIEQELQKAALAVPSPAELSTQLRAPQGAVAGLIGMMTDTGTLVKIHDDIYLHRDRYRELLALIEAHFRQHPELTVSDFKEMTGLTRKYCIPILEYFDRQGLTLRVGDKRMLKNR